jgi:hypothetical protein
MPCAPTCGITNKIKVLRAECDWVFKPCEDSKIRSGEYLYNHRLLTPCCFKTCLSGSEFGLSSFQAVEVAHLA